jgi:TPR repeat protein
VDTLTTACSSRTLGAYISNGNGLHTLHKLFTHARTYTQLYYCHARNNCTAQQLGRLYSTGAMQTPVNHTAAAEHLKVAAAHQHADSMALLARLCARGSGSVPRDLAAAQQLYEALLKQPAPPGTTAKVWHVVHQIGLGLRLAQVWARHKAGDLPLPLINIYFLNC